MGKFAGIGKETWMDRFMLAKQNENSLSVVSTFEYDVTEEFTDIFASRKIFQKKYDLSTT